ncbi:MAG: PHP domain-containing protein [Desulfobulbaceae bacterium]|nr:PHP domain-containing protein [Candidatus Kapabacteria bacterium]MBS4000857.1 PHP domain-containing protein [Desulfobulbaceae bacterium]
MTKKVDLHMHTYYSDGALSPEELLVKAQSVGLSVISITDHDTLDGCINAMSLAPKYGIEIITGCEFSCNDAEREFHVLGYNVDPDNKHLKFHLHNFRNARLVRAKQIHKKLRNMGMMIDFDDILIKADQAPITRPHIAQILLEKGYVETLRQAFDKFIGDSGPAFHPKAVFPVSQAIKLINQANGVAVLAHPANFVDQPTLYKMIQSGLDGIEVIHPMHNQSQREFYRSIAAQYWLLETGGSDFHGNREQDELNFGNFYIPYSIVESIKYHTGQLY